MAIQPMPSLIQKHIAEADGRGRYRWRSHGNHPWHPEERQPRGEAGRLSWDYSRYMGDGAVPDLSDCLAWRSAERPWLLTIWEPLLTKAPAPPKAAPYCCYINTVIFYHFPYIVRPPRGWRDRNGKFHRQTVGSFVEWDRVRTRLVWDELVRFAGERFEIGGGRVMWAQRRWWMCRGARRRAEP